LVHQDRQHDLSSRGELKGRGGIGEVGEVNLVRGQTPWGKRSWGIFPGGAGRRNGHRVSKCRGKRTPEEEGGRGEVGLFGGVLLVRKTPGGVVTQKNGYWMGGPKKYPGGPCAVLMGYERQCIIVWQGRGIRRGGPQKGTVITVNSDASHKEAKD